MTCRHQTSGNLLKGELTSSSRPCGSSSQSSSLRSSPSSPSLLSWPCCPPIRDHLIAACTRESKCTASRIHQHTEKNIFPLKEVLTLQAESARRTALTTRRKRPCVDAKNPLKISASRSRDYKKCLCRSTFFYSQHQRPMRDRRRNASENVDKHRPHGL